MVCGMENLDTTLSGAKGPPPENQLLELTRGAAPRPAVADYLAGPVQLNSFVSR